MHCSIEELKAISEANKNSFFDPDTFEYQHLFVTRTFAADEMGSYDSEPKYPVDPCIWETESVDTSHDRPSSSRRVVQTRLQVYSVVHKTIPDSRLKSAGWKRPKNAAKITYLEPVEWIDSETGEILTSKQARNQGATTAPSISLRTIATQAIVHRCPPSKRDFLAYILKLRSKRGGLVIDLKAAIDRWITYKHPDMDSTDRGRRRTSYEKFLYDRGIMADTQTFTKELQVTGYSTKTDNLREAARSLTVLPIPAKSGCGLPQRKRENGVRSPL